jgi:hypothetical protein
MLGDYNVRGNRKGRERLADGASEASSKLPYVCNILRFGVNSTGWQKLSNQNFQLLAAALISFSTVQEKTKKIECPNRKTEGKNVMTENFRFDRWSV